MRRYTLLPLLALLLGACTATPITLPYLDGMNVSTGDGGVSYNDAMNPDVILPPNGDLGWGPDISAGIDAGMDASSDGACLECPLPDGMPDGMTDSGPGEAGAQPDLLVDGAAGQ